MGTGRLGEKCADRDRRCGDRGHGISCDIAHLHFGLYCSVQLLAISDAQETRRKV